MLLTRIRKLLQSSDQLRSLQKITIDVSVSLFLLLIVTRDFVRVRFTEIGIFIHWGRGGPVVRALDSGLEGPGSRLIW